MVCNSTTALCTSQPIMNGLHTYVAPKLLGKLKLKRKKKVLKMVENLRRFSFLMQTMSNKPFVHSLYAHSHSTTIRPLFFGHPLKPTLQTWSLFVQSFSFEQLVQFEWVDLTQSDIWGGLDNHFQYLSWVSVKFFQSKLNLS